MTALEASAAAAADPYPIRPCSGCGRTTHHAGLPVEQRPTESVERAANELCWACYRLLQRTGALVEQTWPRSTPCDRCGVTRTHPHFVLQPLCRDCDQAVTDLGERAEWGLSDELVAS